MFNFNKIPYNDISDFAYVTLFVYLGGYTYLLKQCLTRMKAFPVAQLKSKLLHLALTKCLLFVFSFV